MDFASWCFLFCIVLVVAQDIGCWYFSSSMDTGPMRSHPKDVGFRPISVTCLAWRVWDQRFVATIVALDRPVGTGCTSGWVEGEKFSHRA